MPRSERILSILAMQMEIGSEVTDAEIEAAVAAALFEDDDGIVETLDASIQSLRRFKNSHKQGSNPAASFKINKILCKCRLQSPSRFP